METTARQERSTGRVLVIDDDEMVRTAIERGLRRLGYEVVHASDGLDGLEKLAQVRPQVVMVDLRMPGIDGHTFLRRFASVGTDAAVVVMSGQGNMDDVVDVLRAGAVDYLKKPWTPGDLLAAVTRGIDAWERRQTSRPGAAAASASSSSSSSSSPDASAATSASTRAAFDEVLTRVRGGDIRLPSIPSVLTELRSLIPRPETTLEDVVMRIERDPQLASEVLRISNTAYYARAGRVHDLRGAVNRIGFRQTYTLVETIFASGLWKVNDQTARDMLATIWQRSLGQAVTMRAVTEMVATRGELGPDTAYLIGLFAEAGASFLVAVASECGALSSPDGAQALRGAITSHHAALGASILQRWKFEPAVAAAVRAHHANAPGPGANPYWPVMVVASDIADELVGVDPTANERRDRGAAGAKARELGLTEPLRRRLLDDLRDELAALSG